MLSHQAFSSLDGRPVLGLSVRGLVEFVWARGDLSGRSEFRGMGRALAGTRGHQRLQKGRPAGYESEVTLRYAVETPEFILEVRGRADGVWRTGEALVIEEIKTVQGGWNCEADPLHWAQGKIYGFIYAVEHGLEKLDVQLVYLDLNTNEVMQFRQGYRRSELEAFFQETIGAYMEWAVAQVRWRRERDESIAVLGFPFPQYREGQRALAVAAYRALANGKRLFAEAPTGIGKTISVLFPAVKALGNGHFTMIFYLTAKTSGRAVAEKAVLEMQTNGLHLRSLTLTAREKICFNEGQPCDIRACRYAVGYYDRVKGALGEVLSREGLTRWWIEEVAKRHQVCPFELSLDAAGWVDLIICDYNYVFDPAAYLRRFFGEETAPLVLLVDEAHNLVDRAREMFSADLTKAEVMEVKRLIQLELAQCAKVLGRIQSFFGAAGKEFGGVEDVVMEAKAGKPAELVTVVREAVALAEIWLARNEAAEFRETLVELYFRLVAFLRTAEAYDERFATLYTLGKGAERVQLYCVDPSELLGKVVGWGQAAVFFSATLRPIEFYRELLGGSSEDAVLRLTSPFPSENLCVLVNDGVATNYRARERTFEEVAASVAAVVKVQRGNYLVYFPSYKYLDQVLERFQERHSGFRVQVQRPGMTEKEREEFLNGFRSEPSDTLVGFAVMGGVFGEGIDLAGDRLAGVVVVGVGLPQVCLERDVIRAYHEQQGKSGFDFAYSFPGFNRVLQAVGRLIRTERDRGVALLIDTRFGQNRYRQLFPEWWRPRFVREPAAIESVVRGFWGR